MGQPDLRELTALIRADPDRAVELARSFMDRDANFRIAAGSAIAQVGLNRDDHDLLNEAVSALRQSTIESPGRSDGWYNLGNALQGLSSVDGTKEPERYLETRDLRLEGRRAFVEAGRLRNPPHIATQALTNLGNWLSTSGRWVEAYEVLQAALAIDPDNGAAAGNLALLLERRARVFPRRREHFLGLAAQYAQLERSHRAKTVEYAGQPAADVFDRLAVGAPLPDAPEPTDPYARWVAAQRLALSLTVEALAPGPRWDDVYIATLRQPMDASAAVPALLAMINVLKQDFLLARKLAFDSLNLEHRADSSYYADTLDYARYGEQPATLTLAQRAGIDILDRIAVTANEYLDVGLRPEKITFPGFWTTDPKRPAWRSTLRAELAEGNRNLLALADLASDIDTGGYLSGHRQLRHTGTHRFIVLHDLKGSSETSLAVEHLQVSDFQDQLMATLRIARAALLYLVSLINHREHRLGHGRGAQTVRLHVPGHHDIRGYTP